MILLQFLILFNGPILAKDIFPEEVLSKEALDALKSMLKHVKTSRDTTKALILEESDSLNNPLDSPCIECPRLSKTANEVNNILKKLVEKPENNSLLEYVEGLEARILIVEHSDQPGDCDVSSLGLPFMDEGPRIPENLVLVFEEEIDPNKLDALILRDGKKKQFFYRGTGEDRDIIVRITKDGEKVKIAYLRDRTSERILRPVKPKLDETNITEEEKRAKEQDKNYWEVGYMGTDGKFDPNNRVFFLGVKHSEGLPEKLVLLDAKATLDLPEGLKIQTESEVSTDKQYVKLKVGEDKQTYAELYVDPTMEPILTIPTKFKVLETPVDQTVKLKRKIDGEYEGELSQNFKIDTNQSLSLGVRNPDVTAIDRPTEMLDSNIYFMRFKASW